MVPARVSALPVLASVVTVTTVLAALPASAQTTVQAPRTRDIHLTMRGGVAWDVGYVALGTGAVALGNFALRPPSVNVAPLDGLGHRPVDNSAAVASDVVLLGGMAGSMAMAYVLERASAGSQGIYALRAPLILGEAALMAVGVVSLLKNAVGECRPRSWSDNEQRCTGAGTEDRLSFPSGHTAPLAAMAGAALGMYLLPTGRRPEFLPLLAVTAALAGTNLALRVIAGAHTWVDTSSAFLLGSGIGFLTAWLHTRTTVPVSVGVSGGSSPQISVGGTF